MSVVINTNYAATVASNNLAASSQLLQKSLNRLSSGSKIVNPADDAGGLAVSMKLSAAAVRQGAVANNVANAVSMLQTQDGVLKVTGSILNRMSELKVLNGDITKSTSDKANYQTEFAALQAQLNAMAGEKFNGVNLFGSTSLSVVTTEDGTGSVAVQGVSLLGTPVFAPFSDSFANLSNWTDTSIAGASASASGGILDLFGSSGFARVATTSSFSGAFSLSLNVQFPTGITDNLEVKLGAATLANINQGNIGDNATHSIRIDFDGVGTAKTYLDGSSTALLTQSGLGAASGAIGLNEFGFDHTLVSSFSITSGSATGNVSAVAGASSLSSLSLASVTSAISDVATYRAQNGASQSRLGFAAELLTVNKANLEAATSRITDVDVAAESTTLARYNILVQAGTAMLSQANQSSQIALKLLQ